MSDAPLPLAPELVDELLSAELDGEFDAAAVDLGMPPATARERLAATPGVEERRAALRAASAAVADTPALDELQDARSPRPRSTAFREHDVAPVRTRPSHRWLVYASGGIAAALIGVFALTALSHESNTTSAASKGAAAPTTRAASGTSGHGVPSGASSDQTLHLAADVAYGSFADSAHLAQAAAAKTLTNGTAYAALAPTATKRATQSQTTNNGLDKVPGAAIVATPSCAANAHAPATTDPLLARGTAVLAGKSVLVRVFKHGSRLVVVILRPDCTLVGSQTVG